MATETSSSSSSSSSSLGYIALTGLSFGVVHVLTGPDHISALASLSANGSYRAFRLGVNWGVGHSTGLIFAYLVFALGNGGKELNFSPAVGRFLDACVGVFMLGLGIWSGLRALVEYRSHDSAAAQPGGSGGRYQTVSADDFNNQIRDDEEEEDIEMTAFNGDFGGCDDGGDDDDAASIRTQLRTDGQSSSASAPPQSCSSRDSHPPPQSPHSSSLLLDLLFCRRHSHSHSHSPPSAPPAGSPPPPASSRSQLVSFLVGILHGFAGPGGILGVVPALRMRRSGALLYLLCFCCSSIVVMGTFAAVFGEASKRLASTRGLKMGIAAVSSSLSLVVGVVWLVLTFEGRLSAVFG